MSTPQIDFYAPAVDHRYVTKQRLGRQRDSMFSWRSDHHTTEFDPVTGERCEKVRGFNDKPRQMLLKHSKRAATSREEDPKTKESIWHGATGHHTDRRREWKVTGFQFERAHFRTSDDPHSEYHHTRKTPLHNLTLAERRQLIADDPYVPYFHDSIVLCEPPRNSAVGGSAAATVTCLAVTHNAAEAEEREREGQMRASSNTENNASNNWCSVLGPSVSAKQRSVELAETMYGDLVMRQSTLAGATNASSTYGAQNSSKLRMDTSELAFSMRPRFVERRRDSVRARTQSRKMGGGTDSAVRGEAEDGRRSTNVSSRTHTYMSAGAHAASLLDDSDTNYHRMQNDEDFFRETECGEGATIVLGEDGHVMQLAGTRQEGDRQLPAEAKSERLYTVQMRRSVNPKDTSMVKRQEPLRKGVPVVLPESWLSPMTFH